jgi:hypothetical protein
LIGALYFLIKWIERKNMKKTICLVGMGLLFVSMALLSCTPAKTVITQSNLPTLRGTWEGWTTFSSFQANPVLTKFEIYNTTIPLAGTITLYNIPQQIADVIPSSELPVGNNVTINFNNGKITDQGTIIGHGTMGNFLELTLYAGEKMKMSGWFYYYGIKGTMDLTKK